MADWIVNAKITPPRIGAALLTRKRVSALLNNCRESIGCLVHAPAGHGKSVALAQWREELIGEGIAVAWLRVDDDDRSFAHFLAHLNIACHTAGFPGFDVSSGNELGDFGTDDALRAALQNLSSLDGLYVVILDDLHRAATTEIQTFIGKLLHSRPDGLKLMLATRELPDGMALADLRVSGDLAAVSQPELAFRGAEIADLFENAGAPTQPDTSWPEDIARRTEGWPIAVTSVLRLVNEGRSIDSIRDNMSGRGSELSDYFQEQVHAGLTEREQSFLLCTSVVEHVNGDLSNALSPKDDGWLMLSRLERKGAFVSKTDDEGNWYRYHRLYREFLEERLRRTLAIEAKDLHLAASNWFRQSNRLPDAVKHAIAAQEIRTCAELLESLGGWQFALRGDLPMVQSVLKSLTSKDLADFPRMWLARVYLSARVGHHRASVEDLKQVKSVVSTHWKNDEGLNSELTLMDTLVQRYTDSPVTMQGIQKIESLDKLIPADNSVLQAVRANFLCAMYREAENYEDSDRNGDLAIEHYQTMQAQYAETFIYYHQGLARMRQAKFRAAEERYRLGLELALQVSGRDSDLVAIGHILLAECLYETGRKKDALALLDRALRHAESADAWLEVYFSGYATLLRIAFVDGDNGARDRALRRAITTASRRSLPRLASLITLLNDDLDWRESGKIATASECLATGEEQAWDPPSRDLVNISRARQLMSAGLWSQARDSLSAPTAISRRSKSFRSFVHYSLLLARIEWELGAVESAIELFDSGLSIAIVENASQVFIEDANVVSPLLTHLLNERKTQSIAPARLAFLRRLQAEVVTNLEPGSNECSLLTAREIDILRCLMLGESNREVASSLSLSVNTVKFHLKNIYSKLSASSRDEAVAYAIRDQLI